MIRQRKNSVGRRTMGKPMEHALELPMYDSFAQMSGATGIPIDVLKFAKQKGCLFSRHNRYDLATFLAWFFSRAKPGENTDWAGRDKRAGALIREINLERLRKTVVDFADADKFIRTLVSTHFFGELRRLRHEFPGGLKGMSETAMAEEVDRQIGIIEKNLCHMLGEWETMTEKPDEVEEPEEEESIEGDE